VHVGKKISMVRKFMYEVNIMWIDHHVKFESKLFFSFYDVIKVVIIHKMNSQIWLHTKYESKEKTKSSYILGYLLELITKI